MYDDESTIVYNYFIRHWSNFPDLFTSKYFTLSAELTYRPVVTLTYFIDYSFWHLNPRGYHLTNILLHAVNSTLFFVFIFSLFKKRTTALISALFFSTYPLFSEVVNAIGFREDLLAFMFLILAFIFYLKANQQRYALYYSLSLTSYFFSIFSKEMAITLPVLIVFYDLIFKKYLAHSKDPSLSPFSEGKMKTPPFFKRFWGIMLTGMKSRFLHYYMGYFLVTIFYILSRFCFLHDPLESQIPYPQDSFFVNFLTMVHVLASYVKLLFLPFHLNADYVVPLSASPVKISFWLSVLLFITIGIFSFRLRKKNKDIFFGILWFFVTLIPVMNIIPLGNLMAERYVYIPGAGFCMIVAHFLVKETTRFGMDPKRALTSPPAIYQRREIPLSSPLRGSSGEYPNPFASYFNTTNLFFVFIIFFILTGNAYLTLKRNNDWKDGLWLWSKTAITSPDSFRAHNNLGNAYEKKGFNTAALEEYKKALLINPDDADIYNNLGIYYNKMRLFDDAIQHLIQCLKIKPKHAKAYNNLGVVLTKQRRLDEAVQAFQQAIVLNHLYPDAHNNLGIAYYRKGLMDMAEYEFKLAIEIEPYHAEAHNDLGILYNDKHLFDDAIREFETAIRIKPDYANAHMNLGAVLFKHRKDKEDALFHLKESIKIEPQQEQAAGINKLIQQLGQSTQ